jgi:hypothetical protein
MARLVRAIQFAAIVDPPDEPEDDGGRVVAARL